MVSPKEGALAVRCLVSGSVLWAFATAIAVVPGEARGQSPSAAARAAVDQARQAYAAGRKREAVDDFKRGYELSGDPSLLFELGEVSRELGQDVAALRFYRTYLARDLRGAHREAADRAVKSLELRGTKAVPAPAASAPPAAAHRAAVVAPAPQPGPAAAPAVRSAPTAV